MKTKITIFIEGEETVVQLQKPMVINEKTSVFLKRAVIKWNYHNISSDEILTIDTNDHTIRGPGYLTLKEMGDFVRGVNPRYNIVGDPVTGFVVFTNGEKRGDAKKTGVAFSDNIARMMGLDVNHVLGWQQVVSKRQANFNGIDFLDIHCKEIVDSDRTLMSGQHSNSLVTLAIPDDQSLLGSVQHFENIESRVNANKGSFNQLTFTVSSNSKPVNVGKIMLEIYVS